MNYIELINHFWRMHRLREFSAHEAFLYFALLNECNLRNWQNPFACTTKSLCAATGMTEKTIASNRNKLKERGLIDFDPGRHNRAVPTYTLTCGNDCGNKYGNEYGNKYGNEESNIIKTETETKDLPPVREKAEREKEGVERGTEKGGTETTLPALHRCREALEADAPWLERLAALHCRGDTDGLRRLMDRFFTRLEAEGVTRKSPDDARSHFARWLALRPAHDKPLKHMQYGSTKKTKDYART